ncbi:MAG: DNA-binding transcriptional LysR family regulator [Marinobacter maritimus]|jgi:DNA-binding transcriptional LysR family regulator|uniref:LysR family transcriptional regulator n=1 Tax=Marinobacter maritimus TaxID=277961 RepID=UPI000BDBC720|nr:LysR family transcriptional regulator [Marinobacter maritimus]MBL1273595.1 LysR family transcriptional regulator [Oceanospirillales bacterium]
MINTTWLRSFCTLVEVSHFTRTAERLHMTQSGVSQHIRKLEDQLETALLFREGKQFSLTDAGQRLYAEGRTIIQALSNLEQRVADDPAYEGPVRVMSPGSVGLKLYPLLLELQRQYPKLVIDYRFAPNTDIERSISNDRIDIGFMTSASTLENVSCRPIAKESLQLVTPADVVEPSWEALTKLGFIDHPDGAHHADMLLGANYPEFEHSNFLKKKGFSNQIGLILEPVSMGLGFTVLPAHAVEAFQNLQLVRIHQLAVPVNETLHLAIRRDRPLQNRMNTVIAEARKYL